MENWLLYLIVAYQTFQIYLANKTLKEVKRVRGFLFKSQKVKAVLVLKGEEMDVMVYELEVTSTPVDTEYFELTVENNGSVETTRLEKGEKAEVRAVQDTEVTVSLVAVDDAGNKGPASTMTATAVDTIPPGEAGFTMTLVREEEVAETPEEPVVEEPVLEESTGEETTDVVEDENVG